MKSANVSVFVPHEGCPNQCSFCNQRRISGTVKAPSPQDVERIAKEGLRTLGVRAIDAQLAFFGGSFTAVPRDYMVSLLKAAAPFIGHDGFSGIRISTRPDAVDGETLNILQEYHVDAVELGAQSMDDRVLHLNARGHTAADVEQASRLIRENGFSLGLQMMTGLPGDSDKGAWETARRLASLQPDTMRIYPTLVLEGTPLAEWWREG
ncbi:MAG: radical SAM protein, partial [Clostridiales bacterium]|nr:radical SAM protein [Clostridiales bacterium]